MVVLAVWYSWCRSKYAAEICGILEKRKKEEGRRRRGKCVEVLLFRLRHMTAGNKILPPVDLAICLRLLFSELLEGGDGISRSMGVLQFYMRCADSALLPADRTRRDHADQPEEQRDVPFNLIVLRACLSVEGY